MLWWKDWIKLLKLKWLTTKSFFSDDGEYTDSDTASISSIHRDDKGKINLKQQQSKQEIQQQS